MNSVDGIAVIADENGFELVIEGDFTELCQQYLADPNASALRFNIHGVASELLVAAQNEIGEWHAMGESVRADHARYQAGGPPPEYVENIDPVVLDVFEQEAETLRDRADIDRKRAKGE